MGNGWKRRALEGENEKGWEKKMRKRITERFPFLLPWRKKQKKFFFYLKMKWDGQKYATNRSERQLLYSVFTCGSELINRQTGYDLKYQYNKVHNLKLAAAKLSGLLLEPGESFSFCLLTKDADKETPYKDGLNLVNGKIKGDYGGGLCQLSNLLYWLFLHSPLTVTERHGHAAENFPPAEKNGVAGVDATISEGWLDLRARNDTKAKYQLQISFDEERIMAALLSDTPKEWEYSVYNSRLQYYRSEGKMLQKAVVCRKQRNLLNGGEKEKILYENICRIEYPLTEEQERYLVASPGL